MKRKNKYLIGAIFSSLLLSYGGFTYDNLKAKIPEVSYQTEGGEKGIFVDPLVTSEIQGKATTVISNAYGKESYTVEYKFLNMIPIKESTVYIVDEKKVTPGGIQVGIYVETEGILVVGTGTVTGVDGLNHQPADKLIQSGDYILAINGQSLTHKYDLLTYMETCNISEIVLTLKRNNEEIQVQMEAIKTKEEGYKLGIWIRDNTQGIGTLTFLDENLSFGALGHGINDVDTGKLMEIQDGQIYETEILEIRQGESGNPGEVTGVINYNTNDKYGQVEKNTEVGIYGTANEHMREVLESEAIPVAYRQEVELGRATIQSAVSGELKEYDVEIIEAGTGIKDVNKGIVLKVVDEELLELTGGIVQGMSGSPLLQDGKLIGAVTHVFVNDPTRGYGIFIENMLETAENVEN